VWDLDQRIPDLSDKDLEQMQANAVRLAQSGTKIQREQAERALPLIGSTLETRRAAQATADQEKRRTAASRKAVGKKAK
jgi:hypothetical protein